MKKIKFSDLYTISSGISSTKEQAGHGSPFLSFSTVFNNFFIPDKLEDLMDTSESEQKTYSIKSGDIFLTRTSEVIDELAMSSVALKDYPNATYSGFLKRLRPIDGLKTYPKFMAFYLRTPLFRKTITNNATMTLRASFNETIFSYLDLLLPDYSEQKKIGDFLYLINQKIALNKQINARLEEMAKTLYDYWFVQFDFPDANGKPYKSSGGEMVFDETLKREIPKGWGSIELQSCLAKIPNTTKILNKDIKDFGKYPVVDQSQDFICGFTNDEKSILNPQDAHIIFGDHTRIVKLVNFQYARGADGTQVILSNNERMPNYLFYQIINQIDLSSYGYARHFKFLKEFKIILPSKDISQKYNEIANTYFVKVRNNIKQNHQLTQLRDFLLPMLMNGQVSVTCSGARDG